MQVLFKDIKQCQSDDIHDCDSIKRIIFILDKYNTIFDENKTSNDEFATFENEIFVKIHYNTTQLLNDFYHIKYDHNVDSDHQQFNEVSKKFNNQCKMRQCKQVRRHYRDRTQLSADNEEKVEIEYMFELMSRIHVYFIHSYHISRLTLNEIKVIDEQLELLKNLDNEILQDKKLEMTTHIMLKKRRNFQEFRNDNKYIEDELDTKSNSVDFNALHKILKGENIIVEKHKLQTVFSAYSKNKNKFVHDIIDTLYGNNTISLDIKVNQLHETLEVRSMIYQCILYKYIKKEQLDNRNFIKIAEVIINKLYHDISVDEFKQVATKQHINGKIFIKGDKQFKKSSAFAQIFSSVTGYKKKHFGQIYVRINKWKPIAEALTSQETSVAVEDEKKEEFTSDSTNKNDVYDLGVRFYYWRSHKYHKNYIERKHSNLKDEIINNTLSSLNISTWQALENECTIILKSNSAKKIMGNGYYKSVYNIALYEPFSKRHLLALKIYTDFSTLCSVFCSTLRHENKVQISEIANMAKLLSECIQCYGCSLRGSKIKTYYRGVSYVFKFEMFVTRFNLPTSTTIDYTVAATRFSNGGNGLVLELCQHKNSQDVFKFDCAPFSCYPEEKESLFFGGNTVLRIECIQQVVNGQWKSYRKYIEPLNAIVRMINGLSVKEQRVQLKHKSQKYMLKLLHHVLPIFDTENCLAIDDGLSQYIQQLLMYHVSNETIKLKYGEIMNDYTWMNSVFIKYDGNKKLLNVSNVVILFCHSDKIILLMPDNYILNRIECASLMKDLHLISKMKIPVVISFKWQAPMPLANKSCVNECLQQFRQLNWTPNFSVYCVSFEYNKSLQYSYDAQQLFQKKAEEIIFEKIPIVSDLKTPTVKNKLNTSVYAMVGDTVIVTTHVHKQFTGIVSHINDDGSLFVANFLHSSEKRLRVSSQNIRGTVKVLKNADDSKEDTRDATEMQSYIHQTIEPNGLNYQRIGRNYETGSNRFPINFNKAMSWYKSGHKLQNIHCTVELANISSDYYHNYDEAERYWNIGIDGGYKHCAFAANVMFRRVPNGKHKELYYIRKYVELTNGTDVGGLLSFAVCQLTMDIPDYSEAYKYLMKAYNLNTNSIGVQQFLAFTVYRGLGCIKNQNKAIEMHKNLSKSKNSECSMLWMAVYNARNEKINNINNIHPLRNKIYNSFINVINNGDSHGLYYGNWLKINKYHAIQKKNIMSSCLFISFTIFGILQCPINIKHAKKCVVNLMELDVDCCWINSWIWFFSERYNIINSISGLHDNVIDVLTELELSIILSKM